MSEPYIHDVDPQVVSLLSGVALTSMAFLSLVLIALTFLLD